MPTAAYIRYYMFSDHVESRLYIRIYGGDVVYLNMHDSAPVSVHIVAYIRFNMKSGACKIEFTQIWHV